MKAGRAAACTRRLVSLALAAALFGCARAPAEAAVSSEDAALACERAATRLAAEPADAEPIAVALPPEVGPAVRALSATGRGPRIESFEAALGRSARLALADAGPCRDADASAAERESALRAGVAAALPPRLAETGAEQVHAELRESAARLPLPRSFDLDLVSLVTDQAVAGFLDALSREEERLREERALPGDG